MVPFAGWEMPLQYAGIVAEHTAVREHAGVFDVSHMGRATVAGPGAGTAIRSITSFDVTSLYPGAAHYSLYCAPDGGIADDVFIYRVAADRWLIVHNASQATADFQRLRSAAGPRATDTTVATAMLAIQGPAARSIASSVLREPVTTLAPRRSAEFLWHGSPVLVARTGYTGEDGVECILPVVVAGELWDAVVDAGATPAGLGARDTLRMEAALPLYGNDIDLATNPYEAGLGWVVTLGDGSPFTGRDALLALKDRPLTRRLACLRVGGRAIPRAGYRVQSADGSRTVGTCTSGAYSPTLRAGIALAYLPMDMAEPGTSLAVDVRGQAVPAVVVPRPFYRRTR
jgi:aminomethyltransferase